jgi:hypothetical protein
MKKSISLLISSQLLLCVSVFAQQNLFNVPSSEITAKKGVFFQQQFNINQSFQSNTNLCFGLGHGFEIGTNIIGVQTDNRFSKIKINDTLDDEPLAPLAVFTFQKVFTLNHHLKVGIGSQIGTNIIEHSQRNHILADFTYLNTLSSFFDEKLKVNAGIYYGDKGYVGEKSRTGYMLGFEAALNNKLHLVGDYIAGKSPISVGVIGFIYYVTPKIPLSFGWQIPNDKSKASQAFVFEFTYVPLERKPQNHAK